MAEQLIVNTDLRQLVEEVEEKNREINELKAKLATWIDNDLSFVSEIEAECRKLKEDLVSLEKENSHLKATNDTLRTELKERSLDEHQFIDNFENDIRNLKALISRTTQATEKQWIMREESFISELQEELRCLKERLENFEIGTTTIFTSSTSTDLHNEIARLLSQLEAERKHSEELHSAYLSVCDQNSIFKEALLIKELTIQKNLKVEILEIEEFRSFVESISSSTSIVTSTYSSSRRTREDQSQHSHQKTVSATVEDAKDSTEGASLTARIIAHGGAIYSSDTTDSNVLSSGIFLNLAGF
jgi:DNA repair exonuclease SbcCD ATPase subunit